MDRLLGTNEWLNVSMVATIKLVLLAAAVAAVIAAAGTARVLPAYNTPATYRLHLVSEPMQQYTVEVRGSKVTSFPVTVEGRVTIEVPVLPRRCSWVCFGIRILDGSPKTRKAVVVTNNGRVVRRFSTQQLERLQQNASNERVIKL